MSIAEHLLNGPLGFGGAPLGNMFRNIPDQEARATVAAAWEEVGGLILEELQTGERIQANAKNQRRL